MNLTLFLLKLLLFQIKTNVLSPDICLDEAVLKFLPKE